MLYEVITTIANFIGGLILLANKPVQVGDFCRYGVDPSSDWLRIGTVEEINWMSTRIRGIDRITSYNVCYTKLLRFPGSLPQFVEPLVRVAEGVPLDLVLALDWIHLSGGDAVLVHTPVAACDQMRLLPIEAGSKRKPEAKIVV